MSIIHGSLEAILSRTKLWTKTKTGDEGSDGPRCPKQVSLKSDLLLPHKVFGSLFFSTSVNFKAFFDKYFVVKSHLRLSKLQIEFNDLSKAVPGFKIRTPWAEILAFFLRTVSKSYRTRGSRYKKNTGIHFQNRVFFTCLKTIQD